MNWRFWKKTKSPALNYAAKIRIDAAQRDGCRHDWTNWTDPVESTVKVSQGVMWVGGDGETKDILTQSRRCIKCNLGERRYH